MTEVRKPEGWTFRRDALRSFRFVRAPLEEATGRVELVYSP